MNNFNIDTSIFRQTKVNGIIINVLFRITNYIPICRMAELKEVLR